MSYTGREPASRALTSADIAQGAVTLNDISFTDQPTNLDISGNIDKHTMRLADGVTVTGDMNITNDLVLSKLSDDGNAIILTDDGTSRTIEGAGGTILASTISSTPNASLTGMTGTVGSAVTGSPNLNLSNATFPAGHVIQTKRMTPDYTNIQQTGAGTIATNATLGITTTAGNSVFIQATVPTRLYAGSSIDNVQVKHHVYHSTASGGTFTKISGTCMFYRNYDYEGLLHNYSQYDISDQLWWLDIGRATTANYYKIYSELVAGTFIKISADGLYGSQMMLQEIQV